MKKINAFFATGIAMPIIKKKKTFLLLPCILFACMFISCNPTSSIAIAGKQSEVKKKGIVLENISNNQSINGSVKNIAGMPLKDVSVQLNGKEIALTNEDGSFNFNFESEVGKLYQIVFYKEGYNKAVRNYNSQIADANYPIVMTAICICNPVIDKTCFLKNIKFDFENDGSKLNDEQKAMLDELIACLKNNPEKTIKINHYSLHPKRLTATDRLETVVKYITQKGIMNSRIEHEKLVDKNVGNKQIEIMPN
jgi:outer membrane protein OmpA-like peptidoglycan-associated protein